MITLNRKMGKINIGSHENVSHHREMADIYAKKYKFTVYNFTQTVVHARIPQNQE